MVKCLFVRGSDVNSFCMCFFLSNYSMSDCVYPCSCMCIGYLFVLKVDLHDRSVNVFLCGTNVLSCFLEICVVQQNFHNVDPFGYSSEIVESSLRLECQECRQLHLRRLHTCAISRGIRGITLFSRQQTRTNAAIFKSLDRFHSSFQLSQSLTFASHLSTTPARSPILHLSADTMVLRNARCRSATTESQRGHIGGQKDYQINSWKQKITRNNKNSFRVGNGNFENSNEGLVILNKKEKSNKKKKCIASWDLFLLFQMCSCS